MKNSFIDRWLIALKRAQNKKLFPFNLGLFFSSLTSLRKKKKVKSIRVVHIKKSTIPVTDNRARLFIVKPRTLK